MGVESGAQRKSGKEDGRMGKKGSGDAERWGRRGDKEQTCGW